MIKFVMYAVFILLAVNVYEIMSLWLSGKYKEIFVKKLVGINHGKIYLSLIFNWFCLVLLSSLIGAVIAVAVSIPLNSLVSYDVTVSSYLTAVIINTALGFVFGYIIYLAKIKNKLLELK